jgi:hypothetical protein
LSVAGLRKRAGRHNARTSRRPIGALYMAMREALPWISLELKDEDEDEEEDSAGL